MNRLLLHLSRLCILAFAGCAPTQFTTITIYETPQSFVRLEVDRTLGHQAGHSHPSDVSPELMAAVLRGITIQEPLTRIPLYDDWAVPRRHPAFSDEEVEFWAPKLSLALRKATSQEIVTFYQTVQASATRRVVTSGGLYVDGDELHLILSNLRSSTHYMADIGVADVADDRLTPMRSIAPRQGQLTFVPESAHREPSQGVLSRLFGEDRRKLIVLYKTLAPSRARSITEDQPTPAPNPQPLH
jgi:hypothetical protein